MKRFNKYQFNRGIYRVISITKQFIVPFCIFQAIRTFFLPTFGDIFLLAVLVGLAYVFKKGII